MIMAEDDIGNPCDVHDIKYWSNVKLLFVDPRGQIYIYIYKPVSHSASILNNAPFAYIIEGM